jgi:hypothetical protein
VNGPLETEQQARELAAVRAVYDAFGRDPGPGKMAPHSHRMLCEALSAAGVDLGAYDHRITSWLATWEPQTVAAVAGWVQRASRATAPGRLSDADRATLGRARDLADATSDGTLQAFLEAHDQRAADASTFGLKYAVALGIAQSLLDDLLRIITRLDGGR